jgi:hypothetical protein
VTRILTSAQDRLRREVQLRSGISDFAACTPASMMRRFQFHAIDMPTGEATAIASQRMEPKALQAKN